ncbi:MAG: FkbM family methyltransferase [Leptolyngbyaceae cyanobacterium bins.59]|nr:FkbM family methyltransferase [Leptolyngbyaceae cyanobacterium bins.59]
MNTVPLPLPLRWLQPFDFPHKLGICDRLFGKALSRHGMCWVDTGAGIAWKLDLKNPVHRWIVYGKYDGPNFLNWAYQFLPADGIIVDSGANIGQVLLYLAQRVPQGKVLAFEPGQEQADWLAECLSQHPQLPIELIRQGLGASNSEVFLANHGPNYIHGFWSHISEVEGVPIQIMCLGDALKARGIERVDLWKLDVEGYEVPALQGAEEFLKNQRIGALYVELGEKQSRQVSEYLARFGYRGYLFDERGALQPCPIAVTSWVNGLFLPES